MALNARGESPEEPTREASFSRFPRHSGRLSFPSRARAVVRQTLSDRQLITPRCPLLSKPLDGVSGRSSRTNAPRIVFFLLTSRVFLLFFVQVLAWRHVMRVAESWS